jgi:hypothetical protein
MLTSKTVDRLYNRALTAHFDRFSRTLEFFIPIRVSTTMFSIFISRDIIGVINVFFNPFIQ